MCIFLPLAHYTRGRVGEKRWSFVPQLCAGAVQLGLWVPAGSPSRRGDVTVYVYDINQLTVPTASCSVLVSVSVFMALSTLRFLTLFFRSFLCLIGPFSYISLYESLLQP